RQGKSLLQTAVKSLYVRCDQRLQLLLPERGRLVGRVSNDGWVRGMAELVRLRRGEGKSRPATNAFEANFPRKGRSALCHLQFASSSAEHSDNRRQARGGARAGRRCCRGRSCGERSTAAGLPGDGPGRPGRRRFGTAQPVGR